MALPNNEDLVRLKAFIKFILANPRVLNLPKLVFVKKFIEKFGGKVPEGKYKMTGRRKCLFADSSGVKTEAKSSDVVEKESEPEEAEMVLEAAAEQEVDMDVATCHDAEEPREDIDEADNEILPKQKKEIRKCRIKPNTKKECLSEDECNIDENYEPDEVADWSEMEDPINTTNVDVIIKTEFDDDDDDMDMTHVPTCDTEDESDDSADNIGKKRVKRRKATIKQRSAGISTRRTRSMKRSCKELWKTSYKTRVKRPKPIACGENCKQKCREKIDKAQRQELCTEFWTLDFVGRKNYLLKWVEACKVGTIRRSNKTTRGYTNRYFLKGADGEKQRVCHSFFLCTLAVSGYMVKKSFDGSDGKGHYIGYDKRSRKSPPPVVPVSAGEEEIKEDGNVDKDSCTAETATGEQTQASVPATEQTITPPAKPKIYTGWNKGKKLKKDHVPQPVKCDEGCQMKCTSHFTEEQRAQMCATFWTMDYKRRKDFVLSRIETREVECITAQEYRKTNRAIRSCSNRYFFRGARGENVRVCAKFFTATLCIGRKVIYNALKHADSQTGAYIGEDKRGRQRPKISEEMLAEVKRHIESYPTCVPHKNHKTRFLHSSLNIHRMYREYKQMCVDQQNKFVSKGYFSNVFHKQYRLAFLKPDSKHDRKVSAVKKGNKPEAIDTPAKRISTNITEYTGEEGNFWMRPHQSVATDAIPSAAVDLADMRQHVFSTLVHNDPNRVQIEEHLQIHAAPQQASHMQSYPAATNNYLQPNPEVQISAQQRDPQDVMSNFPHTGYEQYSTVFRIL